MLRPRLLVTGFGAFPGAPVNPTEALISALEARRDRHGLDVDLRLEVFDVDYRALPRRLEAIGREFDPDIALHFGLSGSATGFRIETTARNVVDRSRCDNAGFAPGEAAICAGPITLGSTLPMSRIIVALAEAGLPAEASDDAGDYLCNYLFYHAAGRLTPHYAPRIAGFIHVPPPARKAGDAVSFLPVDGMPLETLLLGAEIVMATCVAHWRQAYRRESAD